MNMSYSYLTTIYESILAQFYVFLVSGANYSLTGLSALSIVLWKPNVIVSSQALDFEREENRKVISM